MSTRVLHLNPIKGLRHIRNICRNSRRRSVNQEKLEHIIKKVELLAHQIIVNADREVNNGQNEEKRSHEDILANIQRWLKKCNEEIGMINKNKKEEKEIEEDKAELESAIGRTKDQNIVLNIKAKPFDPKKWKTQKKNESISITNEKKAQDKKQIEFSRESKKIRMKEGRTK